MTKYVKSMKFSTSGETYTIRDAEQKERLDTLEPVVQGKQDNISDLDTIRSGATAGSTAVQPGAISDMLTKTEAGTTYATKSELANKQEQLVSGTNIKTVNGNSLLGSGNIEIQGGSGTSDYEQLTNKPSINNVTLTGNKSLSDLGIEEQVNADWDATSGKAQILNKPEIPDVSNYYTKEEADNEFLSSIHFDFETTKSTVINKF